MLLTFIRWIYFSGWMLVMSLIPFLSYASGDDCTYHLNKVETSYDHLSEKDGFIKKVYITGVQPANKRSVIDVYYSELETVTDLEAWYYNNGKKKNIKEFGMRSWTGGSFYSGINSKTFVLEEAENSYDFGYSYTLKNSQLMFLSFLSFNNATCTDTFSYSVTVPAGLKLSYQLTGDTTLLSFWNVSQKEQEGSIIWSFTAIVRERYKSYEPAHRSILPEKGKPGYMLKIVSKKDAAGEFAFMNSWYQNLLVTQSDLNAESVKVIESWGKGKQGTDLVKTLFDSIKTKISYIDFENGLGAVQPRNVNDVLKNRQGDCKDMANLLRQSIRHFGIPANVALSSTLSHPFDLDFPNLHSANHVICVAETEGTTYYLDATESFGIFGYPSRQIQGRKILLIDTLGGQIIKVPVVPPAENRVTGKFIFDKKGDQLEGKFTYVMRGLSKIDIETLKGSRGKNTYNKVVNDYLESQFRNIKLDSIQTIISDTATIITGFATASNAFMKVDNTTYISQSVLMFPHAFPRTLANNERLVFYETLQRDFEFHIRINQEAKFRNVPGEQFSENGFGFRYKAVPSGTEMVINYSYSSDSLEVNASNRSSYNKLNDQIIKIFNKKLAYE